MVSQKRKTRSTSERQRYIAVEAIVFISRKDMCIYIYICYRANEQGYDRAHLLSFGFKEASRNSFKIVTRTKRDGVKTMKTAR